MSYLTSPARGIVGAFLCNPAAGAGVPVIKTPARGALAVYSIGTKLRMLRAAKHLTLARLPLLGDRLIRRSPLKA